MIEYKTGDLFKEDVEALVQQRQLRRDYGARYCAPVQKGLP